jgi:pimeloyl-ACP methyl ester carboxylesterase
VKDAAYRQFATARCRTAYIEVGPADGPLMIFLHGWPHLGLTWRPQLAHFAAAGWRCIAPDLRGYGGSSIPTRAADYSVREVVADMTELHDALGGKPAVWVGHSNGSTIAWAMATHHAERCCGVVNLTVPHFARGNALPNFIPLIDRAIYPVDRYPVGQWDYMLFCNQHFTKAVHDFDANIGRVIDMSYTPGSPDAVGKLTPLASISAQGGWFPAGSKAPQVQASETLLSPIDHKVMLASFARNGFSGPCAWYLNDAANIAFAAEAPDYGRISVPALFLGGQWDTVCDTAYGHLAEPMREDCSNLTEVSIAAGHMLMLERPDEVNRRIADWLSGQHLSSAG